MALARAQPHRVVPEVIDRLSILALFALVVALAFAVERLEKRVKQLEQRQPGGAGSVR